MIIFKKSPSKAYMRSIDVYNAIRVVYLTRAYCSISRVNVCFCACA